MRLPFHCQLTAAMFVLVGAAACGDGPTGLEGADAGSGAADAGPAPDAMPALDCDCEHPFETCATGVCAAPTALLMIDLLALPDSKVYGCPIETMFHTIVSRRGSCWAARGPGGAQLLEDGLATRTATLRRDGKNDVQVVPECSRAVELDGDSSFTPGETIEISADAGRSFPAYFLTLTAPAAPTNVVIPEQLTAGQPFTVTWTPYDGSQVHLKVGDTVPSIHTELHCVVDSSDGRVEIGAGLTGRVDYTDVDVQVSGTNSALWHDASGYLVRADATAREAADPVQIVGVP